jgi:hypothetical protein
VKQVDWHEIAHWLGHDEGEVKELGLHLAPFLSMNVAVRKEQTPRVVVLKFSRVVMLSEAARKAQRSSRVVEASLPTSDINSLACA